MAHFLHLAWHTSYRLDTVCDLLKLVKAADLTPEAVGDVLEMSAETSRLAHQWDRPLGFLPDFISAASAEALDQMLEAWCRDWPRGNTIAPEARRHLHQVAQHPQVRSLSAASHGRLLMLSSTHPIHGVITEVVLDSSSSSSSLEKAEMVHKALRYALEDLHCDGTPVPYSKPTCFASCSTQ